jgi:hypothetical protein
VLGCFCLEHAFSRLCLGASTLSTFLSSRPRTDLYAQVSHTRGEFSAPTYSLMVHSMALHLYLLPESCQMLYLSIKATNRMTANRYVQGLLQISMPFILYWLNYYPVQRKLTLWAGCILCFLSALGGAFATTVGLASKWLQRTSLTTFDSLSN